MKLEKAKSHLIFDHVFFSSLVMTMPMREDRNIPTMATNGDEIRYNPTYVESLSIPEIEFVLAHEALHSGLDHFDRMNAFDRDLWNCATDYVINGMLIAERLGQAPKGILHDAALVAQGGGTAEGVYRVLKARKGQGAENRPEANGGNPGASNSIPRPGEPGGPLDSLEDKPSEGDDRSPEQRTADRKVRVIQAAMAAKAAGSLSASMARLVKDEVKTKTDWRSVLRRFMTEKTKTDWTYAKPKRRFLADDIILPSLTGERLGTVVIAIDCSGSISLDILDKFGAEVRMIVEDTKPNEVEVVYFDSQVLKSQKFTPDDQVKLEPIGGGGTRFSPIFRHIESNPVACVVLTDLECDDFGPMPEYPVLWATIAEGVAPWGEIVRIYD